MNSFTSHTADENCGSRAAGLSRLDRSKSSFKAGRWVIAGLLVLWFVPRATIAWKEDVLFPDGVTYIGLAARMEGAAAYGTLDPRHFNVYPTILMLLHHLGWSWETTGTAWGVFCGTIIVLPLFGWLRRLFNDEIAVVGCILCGLHPKLVEWSPQLIRDPTFCLFTICGLYCSWRAVTKLRATWFLAAGFATFAALQTRFEGWFLLLPQCVWSVSRFRRSPELRRSLVFGWLQAASALPIGLVLVNAAFGSIFSGWIWGGNLHKIGYLNQVPVVSKLIPSYLLPDLSPLRVPLGAPPGVALPPPIDARRSVGEPVTLPAPSDARTTAPSSVAELSIGSVAQSINAVQVTWMSCRVLVRGFGPFYAALFAIGLIGGRKQLNIDRQAVLLLIATTILAIWLHTWQSKVTSSRYALPLVLAGAPFAAIGWFIAADYLQRRFAVVRLFPRRTTQIPGIPPLQAASAALFGVAALILIVDSFLAHDAPFRAQQSLGRWVLEDVGPNRRLAGSESLSVAAYYSAADYYYKPSGPESLATLIQEHSPDVLILTTDVASQAAVVPTTYRQVDTTDLPQECRQKYAVLVRRTMQAQRERVSQR